MSELTCLDWREFEDLYYSLDDQKIRGDAEQILRLRDWFNGLCTFDPLTSLPESSNLSLVLQNIVSDSGEEKELSQLNDRFSNIIQQVDLAVNEILFNPREKMVRDHRFVPVPKVKHLDSKSIQWLSRQPGRNMREKIASSSKLMAVIKNTSLDTLENRLFKHFLLRVERVFLARIETQSLVVERPLYDELLSRIQYWLAQPEVKGIGDWRSLSPNNVLLQDKYYRKVWSSWQELRKLDESLLLDQENSAKQLSTYIFWKILSYLSLHKEVKFVEQPALFQYDQLEINTIKSINGRVYLTDQPPQTIIIRLDNNLVSVQFGKKILQIKTASQTIDVVENSGTVLASYMKGFHQVNRLMVEVNRLLMGHEPKSLQQTIFNKLVDGNSVTVEIGSLNTRIKTAGKKRYIASLRFLRQFWQRQDENYPVDCSLSTALQLGHDTETITCNHLWSNNNDSMLSLSIDSYVHSLKSLIGSRPLTYLVPDYVNELGTEQLRRSLNLAFSDARPLPMSIASLLLWQRGKSFEKANIRDGDLFFIIDSSADNLYMIPVVAKIQDGYKKRLPEMKGVIWERHPPLRISGLSSIGLVEKSLNKELFSNVGGLLSFDEVFEAIGRLSFVSSDGKWLEWPKLLKEEMTEIAKSNQLKKDEFIAENGNFERVRMLSLTRAVKKPRWLAPEAWLNNSGSLVDCEDVILNNIRFVDSGVLWRDHLPQLSTRTVVDGIERDFFFVKDIPPIQPVRGKEVPIDLGEKFVLSAGQDYYELPLFIGNNKERTKHAIRLESQAFPLIKNTECILELSYTYGAEQPYKLIFLPNEQKNAEFRRVEARWTTPCRKAEVASPTYPRIHTWEDFKNYSDGVKKEPQDLLSWLEREFEKIVALRGFVFSGDNGKRITINTRGSDWFTDRNGNRCCKFQHPKYGEIFIHQNNYEDFNSCLYEISLDIVRSNKGNNWQARSITEAGLLPKESKYVFSNSYRFPMLTVWNNGNNLSDESVPQKFKELARQAVEAATQLLFSQSQKEDLPFEIERELQQFLCYLHVDMPIEMTNRLIAEIDKGDMLGSLPYQLPYALGDVHTDWQKSLMKTLLKMLSNRGLKASKALDVLSIAAWRDPAFIFCFEKKQVERILDSLENVLQFDKDDLTSSYKAKPLRWNSLLRKLELLLALIRLRDSDEPEVSKIFLLESKAINKVTKIVEEINTNLGAKLNKQLAQSGAVKSRVKFELNKPDTMKNTPDILYALRLYLTGDTGANLISITGVVDDA
ncbi:DUF2357 domain-containing protein [Pseudoalteromonas sp. CnMc7-37]|uniref:DUF2357 domain-containing protein n=1 Tax=Pseudoalteromonas sp. CnMc7-37 TaxID=2954496 RepID=UPI0020974CA8|nr:DUF2357 domain-containing protein [Pseudoalteromonas sp. CnMc7-37]MCO7205330.1 DUF2357 domain-containing protein [Pseudoalteromonas sp. CnMc7-37]